MNPERADRVQQLYHSALEHDTAERDAFLRQACSDDLTLEQEVRSDPRPNLDWRIIAKARFEPLDSRNVLWPEGINWASST